MILNNRKCIATGKKFPKDQLIRIVKTKEKFIVDSNEKGRGAYVSKNVDLYDQILRNKLLNRAFRTNVPNEIYIELKKVMEENNGR